MPSRSRPRLTLVAAALALAGIAQPVAAQGHPPEPDYQDDRSTPEAVISSFYDAINRREYARAYGSGEPGADASQLPAFDEFQEGYADTASVQLTMGEVGSGVGAGQLSFAVPVTLLAAMSAGSTQTFVGCYTLHLTRPSFQLLPPYRPMGIQRASVQQVDNDADTATLMAQACPPV